MSQRTLFACTWCGAEAQSLDLTPAEIRDAAAAWHAEHDAHNPHHDAPRGCDRCGTVSPVQPVDVPRVIGLQTFDQPKYLDWLDDHDCTTHRSEQLKAWIARVDEPFVLDGLEERIGPRPSWADSAYDVVDPGTWSEYRSEPVRVPMRHHAGRVDGDTFTPARTEVHATLSSPMAGGPAVYIVTRSFFPAEQKWKKSGGSRLTLSEAKQLADTLYAAVELAESA